MVSLRLERTKALMPICACIVGIQSEGNASPRRGSRWQAPTAAGRTGSAPRASASSSGRSGMVSSPLTPPANGSSSRELAYARWAATASSAAHRARPGPLVEPDGGGLARRLPAAGRAMPMTTRRQRRARVSSGYVSRVLRRAALFAAHPGCVSAQGCGSPDRVTGDTMVASKASCDPCHKGRPLATTSMRRAFSSSGSF